MEGKREVVGPFFFAGEEEVERSCAHREARGGWRQGAVAAKELGVENGGEDGGGGAWLYAAGEEVERRCAHREARGGWR